MGEAPRIMAQLGLRGKAAIITNPQIKDLYGLALLSKLESAGLRPSIIEVPDGEEAKSLSTASAIYDSLIAMKADRRTPILALGGGVVGDLGGFVASTYMRGVPYIQIPTSLLAQVDSSVGGKTALNHPLAKNIVGTFYQPKAVLADIDALKTLPQREFLAGLAEVIKYGIIASPDLFNYVEDNLDAILALDQDALVHCVKESCQIKGSIVEQDETERGVRAILNFGHSLGHAIEALTRYKSYRHGEAISIGMVCAARLSAALGLCSAHLLGRVEKLLARAGLPTKVESIAPWEVMEKLKLDKKSRDERPRFVLLRELGEPEIRDDLPEELIEKVIA